MPEKQAMFKFGAPPVKKARPVLALAGDDIDVVGREIFGGAWDTRPAGVFERRRGGTANVRPRRDSGT